MFIFNNSSFFKDKVFTDVFSSRGNNSDDSFGNVSYDSKLQKFLAFWSVVRLELSQRKLHQPSLLIGLLPSINIQPDFVLIAIGSPSHPSRNSLYNKRSAWSVPVNMATFNILVEETRFRLSVRTFVWFWMCHIYWKIYLDCLQATLIVLTNLS